MKQNCWEFKKCGREPGGKKAAELGVCPATVHQDLDGIHGGKNAGRACWVVAGSLCGGKIQGTYASKLANCWRCDFMNRVKQEEERPSTASRRPVSAWTGSRKRKREDRCRAGRARNLPRRKTVCMRTGTVLRRGGWHGKASSIGSFQYGKGTLWCRYRVRSRDRESAGYHGGARCAVISGRRDQSQGQDRSGRGSAKTPETAGYGADESFPCPDNRERRDGWSACSWMPYRKC